MTPDDFIKKYNHTFLDYDGSFGYQCKDEVQFYVREGLGYPALPPGNAWQMLDAAPTTAYLKVKNTPTNVPLPGDVMVWGRSFSPAFWLPYGHISIFVSGDINRFTSFDQNWPTRSFCHLQPHTYKGVVGWLRKK